MSFQILEHVLLTGAGFTRNFGGFLAKDMWARIFNSPDVQSRPSLVRLLKSDFDYESVYRKVIYGKDQEVLENAVIRAYERLDGVVRNFTGRPGSQYPVNLYGVNNFLNRFVGKGNARGYIFTLNQDLFVERWYSRDEILTIPGVLNHMPGLPMRRDLTQDDIKRLPGKGEMENIRAAE